MDDEFIPGVHRPALHWNSESSRLSRPKSYWVGKVSFSFQVICAFKGRDLHFLSTDKKYEKVNFRFFISELVEPPSFFTSELNLSW